MFIKEQNREETPEEELARYNLIRFARVLILGFPGIGIIDLIFRQVWSPMVRYGSYNEQDCFEMWIVVAMLSVSLIFSEWVSREWKHFQTRDRKNGSAGRMLPEK